MKGLARWMNSLTRLPPAAKSLLIVAADVVVLPLALWTAVALRLGEFPLVDGPPAWAYGLAVAVTLPVFLRNGLYHAVIRYLEARAFRLVIGSALGAAVIFAASVLLFQVPGIPRAALLIYVVLSAGYATMARMIARQVLRGPERRAARDAVAVAIYGAGSAGQQLVKALGDGTEYRPVLFIDDNVALHGRSVMGLPIHGPGALPELVLRHELELIIVALPTVSAGQRAQLLRRLEPLQVEVRLIPSMSDLIRNDLRLSDLREVHPEDLLGRDAVQLDGRALDEFLAGRIVMVTGAGGSIGAELCRQIAVFRPSKLVLYEISEFALYTLQEEFSALHPGLELVAAVGDVKDAQRAREVMVAHRPQVLFHAAAYKHVPLMEQVNAWEAVRNNTLGTLVIGQAAIESGVRKFVLVSTDKAVNPTNVMGASKRLAEMVCEALQRQGRTQFEIVRFGNVLGSSGSVIPKFRDQIAAGGPVTVTHPEIVRYFMSIPEAAQLVLQAACMGQGGEVFVLDMGEPVKIVDLARNMIRLSGLTEEQVGIEFTGLRPGEKLYEELLADSEFTRRTHHPKIRVARVRRGDESNWLALRDWVTRDARLGDDEVRERITAFVPEYKPWRTETQPGSKPTAAVIPLRP
jgi:FlaA1/EpsC-like NDP-sugar epimerase